MSYPTLAGMPVIPAADLADKTTDANLSYPNGIGKRDGMFVLVDTGTAKELFMSKGATDIAVWDSVGTQATANVTPA